MAKQIAETTGLSMQMGINALAAAILNTLSAWRDDHWQVSRSLTQPSAAADMQNTITGSLYIYMATF